MAMPLDQDKIKELIPKLVEAIKKRNIKFDLMDLSTIQDQQFLTGDAYKTCYLHATLLARH